MEKGSIKRAVSKEGMFTKRSKDVKLLAKRETGFVDSQTDGLLIPVYISAFSLSQNCQGSCVSGPKINTYQLSNARNKMALANK